MSRMDDYNYFNDRRVISAMSKGQKRYTVKGDKLFLEDDALEEFLEYSEDREEEYSQEEFAAGLPVTARFEVCDLCHGHGTVTNPSIDCNGLTQEDFDNDPDFREDYLSGVCNIPCPECDGLRVVPTYIGTTDLACAVMLWLRKLEFSDAEYEAECRAERRMGC